MATREEALAAFGSLIDSLQPRTGIRKGKIGDGNGSIDLVDKPGWSWVRFDDAQSKLTIVRNVTCLGFADGTPIIVGKWHYTDKYEQVLRVDWGAYLDQITQIIIDQYVSPPHGETHISTGSDPAPIDMSNMVNGKVVATVPASLTVYAQFMLYPYGLEVRPFYGNIINLAAHVPLVAGHRYTLVYLNTSTGTLGAMVGTIVPTPITPTVPMGMSGTIPLAIVEQYFGQTTITNPYIHQWKIMWGTLGGTVPPHTHSDANSGGTSIIGLEELFFACSEPIFMLGNSLFPVNTYHEVYIPVMYADAGIHMEEDLIWIHSDPVYGCGQLLILKPADPGMYSTYRINVRHGIGNIWLSGERDIVLSNGTDHLFLIYNGQYWCDYKVNQSKFGRPTDGHYSEFETDGTLVFNGNATVWEDLRVPGSSTRVGASAPDMDAILASGGIYANGFDGGVTMEQVFFQIQIPHSYKQGTTIHPHVHWMPSDANAGTVQWNLEYSWSNINGVFGAPVIITVVQAAAGAAWTHQFAEMPDISGVGKTISSMLVCRLYRNPNLDTYASDAILLDFDIHYQIDTVGSRLELTK